MNISILSAAYRGLSAGTHMSIVNAMAVLGWGHRIVSDDALLDHARGILVSAWYRETQDYAFVMIDDDIEFVPNDIEQLVNRLRTYPNADMVSAVYPARVGQTLIGTPLDGDATWPEDGRLIELDRGGLGCLAVRRSAITCMIAEEELLDEDYSTGSFWPLFMPYARNRHYMPDDTSFYYRARDVNCRAWLDPKVRVKHLSNELPVTMSNMFLVNAAYTNSRSGGTPVTT